MGKLITIMMIVLTMLVVNEACNVLQQSSQANVLKTIKNIQGVK